MTYTFTDQVGGTGYLGPDRAFGASTGSGYLFLDGRGGGTYAFTEFFVARAGAEGTVVLDQGTAVTVSLAADDNAPDIDVGATGDEALSSTGTLAVLGGSTLSLEIATDIDPDTGFFPAGYESIRVGAGIGGTGTALVSGEGSLIESSGGPARIRVGRDGGEGELTVEQGGEMRVFNLEIGRGDEATTGRVVVDGSDGGARIAVGSDYGSYAGGTYAGSAGAINVSRGSGGDGRLEILNGGEVIVQTLAGASAEPFFRIARDEGGTGSLLVSGSNDDGASRLTVQQNGPAGGEGQPSYGSNGPLVLFGEGGVATVEATDGGQIGVLGQGATLVVSNGRGDGVSGQSTLTVSGGASIAVDSGAYLGSQLLVGRNIASDGALTVSGAGSTITVRSDETLTNSYDTGAIAIGVRGTGVLTVEEQAAVYARRLLVGEQQAQIDGETVSGGNGTVTISGGALIEVRGYSATPYQGIRVANGGTMTSGTITVTGEGSRLISGNADTEAGEIGAGQIRIGRFGGAEGELVVEDGGYVGGFFFDLGRDFGTGTVRVDGGTLKLSDTFGRFREFSEEDGFGDFVEFGAVLNVGRDGGTGAVEITGGGLLELSAADETVPAVTTFPQINIGTGSGSGTGSVLVDGDGSMLVVTQGLRADDAEDDGGARIDVGEIGEGSLTVSNNASVLVDGGLASITVGDGAGQDEEGNDLPSSGTLTIESGGAVRLVGTASDGTSVAVGRGAGGVGTATIDGGSLTLSTMQDEDLIATGFGSILSVGRFGEGALTVSGGGEILLEGNASRFPGLQIGRGDDVEEGETPPAASGTVVVTGEGSQIVITGESEADFTRGFIDVGDRPGSSGSLEISEGGLVSMPDTQAATIIADEAGSTGSVLVAGEASRFEAGSDLFVGVTFDRLVGADSIDFATGGDGSLTIDNGATVTAGTVRVGDNGTLDLDGTLSAGMVEISGTLAVGGRNVGAATVEGSVVIQPGMSLDLTVTGGNSDLLTVTGDVSLDITEIDVSLRDRGAVDPGEDGILVLSAPDALGITPGQIAVGERSALFDLVATETELRVVDGDSVSGTQARTVALLYEAALDRDGEIDVEGVNFWIDAREGVVGPMALAERQVAQAFLQADEFEESFGPVDDLTDLAYIEILYQNILDRDGEDEGIDFWTGRLEDGAERDEVLLAFAKSPENIEGSPDIQTLTEVEDGTWDFVLG